MKKITAIVRPEKMEPLKDALFAAKVSGMTISQVQGCGSQHGWKEYYRGSEVLLNMIPKMKFDLIVSDEEVDELIDLILSTTRTGEVGDGKIFIFPKRERTRSRLAPARFKYDMVALSVRGCFPNGKAPGREVLPGAVIIPTAGASPSATPFLHEADAAIPLERYREACGDAPA